MSRCFVTLSKRPNLDVAVQEDFLGRGTTTLEKLDDYIEHCDAVIHLIGWALGAVPEEHAVDRLLQRRIDLATRVPSIAKYLTNSHLPSFSYTQWEAYLALYHKRPLYVYLPSDFQGDCLHVTRDPRFKFDPSEVAAQKEHYERICALGWDRREFQNEERLSVAVLRDLVEILPRLEQNLCDAPPPTTDIKCRISDVLVDQDVDKKFALVDFRISNPTDYELLINRLKFEVIDVQEHYAFEYMTYSTKYDFLDIEPLAGIGDMIECEISQRVTRGGVDRFGVKLAAPGLENGVYRMWVLKPILFTNIGELCGQNVEVWLPKPLRLGI